MNYCLTTPQNATLDRSLAAMDLPVLLICSGERSLSRLPSSCPRRRLAIMASGTYGRANSSSCKMISTRGTIWRIYGRSFRPHCVEHELASWKKGVTRSPTYSIFTGSSTPSSLGAEFIGKLFCYERWIVAFANILFEKSILTPDQLARKMDEVSTRFHSIGDIRTTEVANFLVPTAVTKNVFKRIWPPPGRN